MSLATLLDPVLGPLLKFPDIVVILFISLAVTFIMTLIYKFTTDQKKMRALKDEMKQLQKKMKELQKDPKKAMSLQKQIMEKNMEYMKHSFKVTIITFIPIILIFAWLNANIAYEPIKPGEEFNVTLTFNKPEATYVEVMDYKGLQLLNNEKQEILRDEAVFSFKADHEGKYLLTFLYNNKTYDTEVLVSETNYGAIYKTIKKSSLEKIIISYKKSKPLGENFNIFGWYPGFLSIYIVVSILSSIIFRKILNVA